MDGIAKAIRFFAEQDEAERLQQQNEMETPVSVREIAAEVVREVLRELRKAGFNPNEPRVPAGNPDGGRWTTDGGSGASSDPRIVSDATPDNNWMPGAQYAANDLPGASSLDEPPVIPPEEPATAQLRNAFLKAVAYWLAEAALAGEPIGDLILALQAAEWLTNYLPYIYAYLDPPKTLEELQRNVFRP